jgi:hypothetical protein
MMAMLIITGQAGGSHYTSKGGGSEYLCLPNDPDNGKPYSYANDVLYGAEYEINGSQKPSGFGDLHDRDVPCAVCRRRGKSSVLMIPGNHSFFIQLNQINSNKMSISYPQRVVHDMTLLHFQKQKIT